MKKYTDLTKYKTIVESVYGKKACEACNEDTCICPEGCTVCDEKTCVCEATAPEVQELANLSKEIHSLVNNSAAMSKLHSDAIKGAVKGLKSALFYIHLEK